MSAPPTSTPRLALIAGEPSGDLLGAALIRALSARLPDAHFSGVAGVQMCAAGCRPLARIDALSVMGLAEVLRHLPRLLLLRRRLTRELRRWRPDVVIGIDAPDFNLPLERRLRRAGLRTLHVVSPTVWAWRAGRVHTVAAATQRLLVLLPFEPDCYRGVALHVDYIGHPLADEIDAVPDPLPARAALDLDAHGPVLAVLPGSRRSEVERLAMPFAAAVALLTRRRRDLQVVTPLAAENLRAPIEAAIAAASPDCRWRLIEGRARVAMAAADAVLLASGTAALEALLIGRPMVVGYRVSPVSAALLRRAGLLKIRHVSLPNLLCSQPVVPEFLQRGLTPPALADALEVLFEDGGPRRRQLDAFAALRPQLRRGAAARAAGIIAQMLER
ncbi:MAG: lipid-A-disaccharide synthase [Gammaproteobacteria bacterium]|nr:lipid-A-disaccharide synthase [Gammaproteobacteria bacterium]